MASFGELSTGHRTLWHCAMSFGAFSMSCGDVIGTSLRVAHLHVHVARHVLCAFAHHAFVPCTSRVSMESSGALSIVGALPVSCDVSHCILVLHCTLRCCVTPLYMNGSMGCHNIVLTGPSVVCGSQGCHSVVQSAVPTSF